MEPQESSQISKKTVKNLAWYTLLPIMMQIIRFGSTVILARILSPHDFGIVGIVSVITYYCNNISTLGLGNAIVQKKDITKYHLNTFFTFNLIVSLILFFIFIQLSESIAEYFQINELKKVIIFYSLVFILTSFYSIGYTKLRRDLAFKYLAINENLQTLCSIVISLILAFAGYGYWALLVATISSMMLATIAINIEARLLPKIAFNKQAFGELWNYASWNFVSQQTRLLNEYIDKFIIGKILGATSLGYYEKSFGIAQMPNDQISNKINVVSFSTFSRCQGNAEEINYLFVRIFITSSFMIFPIYFGLFAISESLVLVLFGQKWQAIIPSFQILLAAFLVSSISALFSTINITCNHHKQDTTIRLACILVVVPCLILVANRGIEFVATVVLLNNILFLFLSLKLAQRAIALSVWAIVRMIIPAFLGSGIMMVILFVWQIYIYSTVNIVNLSLQIIIGFFFYSLWFFSTKFETWHFLREKSISFIRKLISR